jgi:glutamate/tyrosine decarboxylase-like PLP-dependent enzyme
VNRTDREMQILEQAMRQLSRHFVDLPARRREREWDGVEAVITELAGRLADNYPYHHPLYAGQMLKPPHPVARIAYCLAMQLNPNNHALDGGRASSQMEKEAVAELARMFGWSTHLGHLTGGGTMANLEALWVAGEMKPGRTVLASEQAHYTHSRISKVLKLPFDSVPVDRRGRMDRGALEQRLGRGDVGIVVATLGTTGAGAVDPLPDIIDLARRHGCRVHVDSAYGGYFVLVDNLGADTRAAYASIRDVDSVVVDPHKHGLQPYGCGCVLFADPEVGRFYVHDSAYTYFTSADLHLGEISLECSRPGAAAVALWATHRLMPPVAGGSFAADLARCRAAALELWAFLDDHAAFRTIAPPELDIVVWAPVASRASEVSRRSRTVFDRAADSGLHLALAQFPRHMLAPFWPDVEFDVDRVTCLRSCLMKPEHEDRIGDITGILNACVGV